jgi:translation initiation factor eIF-2B subunit epsilon
LKVNTSFFESPSSVIRVRTGLRDTRIYIGTWEFLQAFQHNFDWHLVLEDCIPQTIRNFEIDRFATFAEITPNCYSTCTDDLLDYLRASAAVLRRWLYPLTIEMNFFAAQPIESCSVAADFEEDEALTQPMEVTAYRLERDLVYLHENVFPSLTAKVGHSVVIGSESTIGADCIVKNSTIGSRCHIERGAVITNSIIWDRVTVEEDAVVDHCLIASGCTIRANVHIAFGCLLSFECCCDRDLPPCRRLATYQFDEETQHFRDRQPLPWLTEYLSHRDPVEFSDDDSSLLEISPMPIEHEIPLLRMWLELGQPDFPIDPGQILPSEPPPRDDEEEQHSAEECQSEDEANAPDHDAVNLSEEFQHDAASLLDALLGAQQVNVEQVTTEFVSLEKAQNPTHIDCAVALWTGIQRRWGPDELDVGVETLVSLVASFLAEVDDQVDFLFWWQCEAAKNPDQDKTFLEGINLMKVHRLVSREALRTWKSEQEDLTERQNALFALYEASESADA